jgi:hypothetical protein
MLTRTYASIIKILELPFIYAAPPMGVDGPWVQRIYQGREIFLNFLMGFGVYFSVLTFLILSFFCFRTALFFLLFLLFFGGYPVLQFQGRHYFHLEFISWWTFGFLIQQMRTLVRFLQKNGFKSLQVYSLWNSKTRNVLTFVFFATIALTFPLFVLRSFQSHQVRNLLLEYTRAEKKPLTIKAISLNEKMVLLETPEFKKEFFHPYFDFKFLVAQFHRNHSDRSTVWPLFQYQYQDSSRWDFSRGIQMNLPKSEEEVTQFFLPVMKVPKMPNQDLETPNQSVFSGIQMPKKQLINLEGLYWVKDPSSFPIILSTQLFENGQSVSTHQKILRFQGKTCYSLPFTIEKGMEKKILTADLKSIAEEDIEFQANILRKVKNKWIIHGYAKAPMDSFLYPGADRSLSQTARVLFPDIQVAEVDTDLLLTRKKWLKKGSYFRAKGKLYTGGITFGLIREGWSSGYVTVPHRGPFSVIIEVPEDGFYSLGLANRLNIFTSLENRLTLSQFGWVEKSEI